MTTPHRDPSRVESGVIDVKREVFDTSRAVLGAFVLVSDLLIAVGVPLALRDHGPRGLLIAWGVAIACSSYLWELVQRRLPDLSRDSDRLRDRWGWASTIVWAALPWIVVDALDEPLVAWVLVFVVTLAITTDLMFLSQTDAPSLDWMVMAYASSYVLALTLGGQIFAVAAILISGVTVLTAWSSWRDVSVELIAKRVESDERSRVDSLTGLATRLGATEAIDAMRGDGAAEIHCAFVDIDDFKHLNDNHGYDVGDATLRAVGALLRNHVPPSWTMARFGGDEFVGVGPEAVDFDPIIDAVIRPGHPFEIEIAQSLTVGQTVARSDTDAETLYREAAAALRLAKRLGKHQTLVMTDELRAIETAKTSLATAVGAALDAGEIVPFAQRIVDLDSGACAGFELLARWARPDGAIVTPDEFVPLLEDQGRGPALGLLMIRHAVEGLAHPTLRNRDVFISVNVSARHLYHRRLPTEILDLLGTNNVDPGRLVLEITESQHLPSSPIWRDTANRLRTIGIGLALDDFGTGYSTMQQLLEVPFSHVKVDRFISQTTDRPGADQLASAIASMADGTAMTAIVEAIETEEQEEAMRAAGYRLAQGYRYHRPEPLADAIARLRETPSSELSI